MLSQSSSRSFRPLSLVHAPLAGRGLCSSLLVLLAMGAVSNSWAGDCNIVVGSTADSGGTCTTYPAAPDATCTLRQAIAIATATTGQTICFAAGMKGQTITLVTQLSISNTLTIQGQQGQGGITISGNNATRIARVTSAGNATFNGLIFTKGQTTGTNNGAAILNSGTTTVVDSTLTSNTSAYDGGAIYNTGNLTVQRSTFSNNTATTPNRGGAIYSSSNLTVENSTFSANQADNGGAIYLASGQATLRNNTISGNIIPDNINSHGGGIFVDTDPTFLYNNLLANSTREDCHLGGSSGYISGANNNLIQKQDNNEACAIIGLNGNIDNSPGTLTLGSNGGPTQTMAINSSSPAYNAGNSSTCLPTDQRGVTRPQYGACDIGAYEASARAGSLKLKLVKKGQCKTPCSGDNSSTYPPDAAYPQLSLKGVCWAYVNLQNITGTTPEGARNLTNITTELVSVTNNNWVLNTNTIPMQGGGAVLIEPTPSGCTDSGIPIPTGTASSLGDGQTINVWYKVGMMNAGPYVLNTKLFLTDSKASAMSFGSSSNSMPVVIEELGEFTVDFNSQEEQGDVGDAPQEGALLPPMLKPIDSGFIKRVLAK